MGKTKIITDCCSDVDESLRAEYDIDCIPLTLVHDGKETVISCESSSALKRFYDGMRAGGKTKIVPPPVEAFEKAFGEYASAGDDIVYIACASAAYNAYSTATAAAKTVCEKYRGAKIFCVNSNTIGGAQALVTVEAARFAAAGHTVEEVFEHAKKASAHARTVGTSDTFEYLKRAGIVKASAALFGNLFGIKPIIVDCSLGVSKIVKRVKGRQNALDKCVEILKIVMRCDLGDIAEKNTVIVAHADCADAAEYVAEKLRAEMPSYKVAVAQMGMTVGALFGPSTVTLSAFGKRE